MSLLYISFNFSVFEFFMIKYWRKYVMLVKIITGIWKSKKWHHGLKIITFLEIPFQPIYAHGSLDIINDCNKTSNTIL